MKIEDVYNEYDRMYASSNMPFIRCKKCGKAYYYPRTVCPFCGSSIIEIIKSSGTGEIYSCTEFNGGFYGIIKFKECFGAYMDIKGNNIVTGRNIIIKFREISGKILPYAFVD